MHIGVVLPQAGTDWPAALEMARFAEDLGVDSVWVVDHVLGFPPERGILESWTTLSALAASTSKVQIGAQVFCQSFRSPALLAKMAATLDQISGGRLRLLIGAGWFEAEYDAFGWDFPEPGTRFEQLAETVAILKGMLSGKEEFSFEGKHHRVNSALNAPPPVRVPMPIEIGAARDRMLRFVAREADGWNCPGAALPALDNRLDYLTRSLDKAGRSLSDLRLSCQIVCAVGDDEAAQDQRLQMFSAPLGLVGTVDQATERAAELVKKGFSDFLTVVPRGDRGKACLERLVTEVRPNV